MQQRIFYDCGPHSSHLLLLSNSDLRNAGRVRSIRLAVTLGSGQAEAASRRRKAVAGWPQASQSRRGASSVL